MGRPSYLPTHRERERVTVLVGAGWGERDIAMALGIARETLRRHFHDELAHGRVRCRALVVEALFNAARIPGRTAAQKAWLEMSEARPKTAEDEAPLRLAAPER